MSLESFLKRRKEMNENVAADEKLENLLKNDDTRIKLQHKLTLTQYNFLCRLMAARIKDDTATLSKMSKEVFGDNLEKMDPKKLVAGIELALAEPKKDHGKEVFPALVYAEMYEMGAVYGKETEQNLKDVRDDLSRLSKKSAVYEKQIAVAEQKIQKALAEQDKEMVAMDRMAGQLEMNFYEGLFQVATNAETPKKNMAHKLKKSKMGKTLGALALVGLVTLISVLRSGDRDEKAPITRRSAPVSKGPTAVLQMLAEDPHAFDGITFDDGLGKGFEVAQSAIEKGLQSAGFTDENGNMNKGYKTSYDKNVISTLKVTEKGK